MPRPDVNSALARSLLRDGAIKRLSELRAAGVYPATLSRLEAQGAVLKLGRGLYQASNADLTANHDLAEASLKAPTGVICLTSALAFHGLTDQMPARVWVAIGQSDHALRAGSGVKIVRFNERLLTDGVERHMIEGVSVKIFGVAKTIADCFRHRNTVGLTIALEGLQQALAQRKATPGALSEAFANGRVTTIAHPYLEALTANG
ncbi:MAG: transcriptional regulator [Caulobacteraceae bacterium]|nr:transcriptional regulator [Caulobacteraceae bacterium]